MLLLSNDGAPGINRRMLEVLAEGRTRESLQVADLETDLSLPWLLEAVTGSRDGVLVDAVVPFMPLEARHVVQCIKAEVATRNLSVQPGFTQTVLDHLQFFPADSKQFSKTGCRRISYLIDYLHE